MTAASTQTHDKSMDYQIHYFHRPSGLESLSPAKRPHGGGCLAGEQTTNNNEKYECNKRYRMDKWNLEPGAWM